MLRLIFFTLLILFFEYRLRKADVVQDRILLQAKDSAEALMTSARENPGFREKIHELKNRLKHV